METKVLKPQRLEWIDSIRGIAAFGVMVTHYFHMFLLALLPVMLGNPSYLYNVQQNLTLRDTINFMILHHLDYPIFVTLSDFILGYWDIGKIGVTLFFLVSGFVIPYSMSRPYKPVQNFIFSRIFRLYPIYWFALIAVMLFLPRALPFNWIAVILNFTMFQKFVGIRDINGVAWTLQIELVFYITAAILLALKWLHSTRSNCLTVGFFLLASLVMAVLRFKTGIDFPIALGLGLALMFSGYLWRKWLFREDKVKGSQVLIIGLSLILGIPLICWIGYGSARFTYINTYLIAIALFILFTTVLKMRQPFFLFLGKISYSVYLLHVLVGSLLVSRIVELSPALYLHDPVLFIIPMSVCMAISVGISTMTYQWIEFPSSQWGKQLARKYFSPPLLPGSSAILESPLPS